MGRLADTTRPSAVRSAKAGLRRIPPLHRAVRAIVNRRRVADARKAMRIVGMYPDEREAIVADFAYACSETARGVGQVLNLEAVVRWVGERGIPGAVVECGTFTGGALAYTLLALKRNGDVERPVWGFDSFAGMPNPTPEDGDDAVLWILGKTVAEADAAEVRGRLVGSEVNRASHDRCLEYLHGTGYPTERIHLVEGWFQETLPVHVDEIGPIGILRLDGDLYESTRTALEHLYDLVVPGGIVIVDDYGTFEGCRRAVDELLAARQPDAHLVYVDVGIRYFVKSARQTGGGAGSVEILARRAG